MDKKRVIIVAPIIPRYDIRVYHKEAKTLINEGWEVYLITQSNNNRINLISEEDICIVEIPKPSNLINRILNIVNIYKLSSSLNGYIYHFHNPDTIPIAILVKLSGKKVVYDTHEDFALRIKSRDWLPLVLRTVLRGVIIVGEYILSIILDKVIVTQSQIVKRMFSDNVIIVENAPIIDNKLTGLARNYAESLENDRSYRLIYIGVIGETRGIANIIESLCILNKSFNCRLWLIGPCHSDYVAKLKMLTGWKYVDHISYIPLYQAYGYVLRSDIGIVTIKDVVDHSVTSPNKLFEYQMLGKPFIASNFKHWMSICGKKQSGLFVDPDNINEIVSSVVYYFNNPKIAKIHGENGKEFINNEFNWDIESIKIINLYNEIVNV